MVFLILFATLAIVLCIIAKISTRIHKKQYMKRLERIYIKNYMDAMTDFEEGYWYAKCRKIQKKIHKK